MMPEREGQKPFNVVLFGETGAGKSSLINMLVGSDRAATSNQAVGCTINNQSYDFRIKDTLFRIWDTAGLNETDKGTVAGSTAITQLGQLFEHLTGREEGGVHLLLYCVAGMGFREIMRVNYDLVWGIMCQMQIPVVFVVTKQEHVEGDQWWKDNHRYFAYRHPRDREDETVLKAISVTATKGKNDFFAAQFAQSTKDMEYCLLSAAASQKTPSAIGTIEQSWFSSGKAKKMTDEYLYKYTRRTNHERDVLDSIRTRLRWHRRREIFYNAIQKCCSRRVSDGPQQIQTETGRPLRTSLQIRSAIGILEYLKSLFCRLHVTV